MTVRSLQHVALAVPDPAVGRKFYQEFGLEAREEGRRIVMRCSRRPAESCTTCASARTPISCPA